MMGEKLNQPTMMAVDFDDGLKEYSPLRTNMNRFQLSVYGIITSPFRAAAVCLGMLCLLLLAGIIGLGVLYDRAERNQRINYSLMPMTKDSKTNYNNLTKEGDQLLTSYNELQTSYDNLTEGRDLLQTSYNQLQTSYNNLTNERDQLQISYNNLTDARDQLQTSYNQLQTSHNSLMEERDQLQEEVERLNLTIIELTRCPEGWSKLGSGCYFISTEGKTWEDSREDCESRGADLVIINSREEQMFLRNSMEDTIWLGLSDRETEGTWQWVDGSHLNNGFWASGEPNDSRGLEDCAELVKSYNAWNDQPCSEKRFWICEKKD